MKRKTNFDHYLEEQLKDQDFAERFKKAGEAWDIALGVGRLEKGVRPFAEGACQTGGHDTATDQPAGIAGLRRPFPEHAQKGRRSPRRHDPYRTAARRAKDKAWASLKAIPATDHGNGSY